MSLFISILLALFILGKSLAATPSVNILIISGLPTDPAESDRLQSLRERLTSDFVKRGVPSDQVQQWGDQDRATILGHIADAAKTLHPYDSLWLILLGHSQLQDNQPVFSVKGEPLTAEDLKVALGSVRAKQNLILTTEYSGAYIVELAQPNRLILAATEPSGEVSETVFPRPLPPRWRIPLTKVSSN